MLPEVYADDAYLLIDAIPEVAAERAVVRGAAEDLLDARREERLRGSEAYDVPVDALSTAYVVLETAEKYGFGSHEYAERYDGLRLDCQRLLAEWYRKMGSEYFPPLRHAGDEETEDFYSHGFSLRQMTENALLPIAGDPEEEQRRINERVEDATPWILRRQLGGMALSGQVIRTISECTDKALEDYQQDVRYNSLHENDPDFVPVHRGYGGYVPETEKLMIRDSWLDPQTGDRLQEQVALPGSYITHYIVQLALKQRGVDADTMTKGELHGAQFLARDDLLGFVALLDEVASEQWCTPIFMGEEVVTAHPKDYESFRHEALERQAGLQDKAVVVADFILDLAREGADRRQALTTVEEYVKHLLLAMAKGDSQAAEQMFDARTAKGLRRVAELEAEGRHEEASSLMRRVEKAAPGGGFCGAGSCGLEGVGADSTEAAIAKRYGLKTENGELLKDNVRKCPECKSAKIYYDMSGGKACLGCGFSNRKAK